MPTYLTLHEESPTNPYYGDNRYLELADTLGSDLVIVFHEFIGASPYSRSIVNLQTSDEYTINGNLKLKGITPYRFKWDCSFLVGEAQLALFEFLLLAQSSSSSGLSLFDRFSPRNGSFENHNVWIEVSGNYRTIVSYDEAEFSGSRWDNSNYQIITQQYKRDLSLLNFTMLSL
jgi:hypothetical protein